jgi:integrase
MQIRFKDEVGAWHQKWKSTGLKEKGNKRNAEQQLKTWLDECNDVGGYNEPSEIMFSDWVRDWVEISRPRLQATTYTGYIDMLNKHICPYFQAGRAKLQLKDITPDSIQRYYSAKNKEGLSPNTVIKHHAVIRSALKYAVKSRLIKENPCDFVDRPKTKKFAAEFYSASEIQKLLAMAEGTPIEVPVFIAAHFGLRRSETIGLRWSAIDLSNGHLTVCHKVVRAAKDGKIVKIATDELKTESSHRVLPLDEKLIKYFSVIKSRQEQNRKLCGNTYSTEYQDYVCVNGTGELLNPDYVSIKFGKLIKRNGLKHILYHDLRHSCASLLLSLGCSMKEIQEWLGHSNYLTTANLYSHVDPRNKKSMIQGLSIALE